MVSYLPQLRGSSYCHAGMTPQQIAEVRPRLLAFAGEMLGGLARKDQRAAGGLYVRGLLTDGRRKSRFAYWDWRAASRRRTFSTAGAAR
jgi:hypothetical protein